MKQVVFALPGNEKLAALLAEKLNASMGETLIRQFPDEETYVRILTEVSKKNIIVLCTLHRPDDKLLPLYFLCKGLKELGANKVTLIAPYLAYMRQDKRFQPGEVVSSEYFARLVSSFADELITIDPHLHRHNLMADIYSIPCQVLHASELISSWIKENIEKPLLIGPDSESEQWVAEVAANSGAPFIILEKNRFGDRDVQVTLPQVENFKEHTPVLVDDIISTARTMIETVNHLKDAGMRAPVCIGVHPVFAGDSFSELLKTGVNRILSCNTIEHPSNGIDISGLLLKGIRE